MLRIQTDGFTSLREAIAFANDTTAGVNSDGDADGDGSSADMIAFDPIVFSGGDNNVIRLTQGELMISESLSIDGSSVGGVVITGDSNGNDITVTGTHITDVSASVDGIVGAAKLLDDNSRVIDFLGAGNLTLTGLTITGGRVSTTGGGGIRTSGNVLLINSEVSGNSTFGVGVGQSFPVVPGGGIHSSSGNVSLTNSTVSGNSTSGFYAWGGGIFTDTGDVSLTDSTVSGNRTSGSNYDGGGIFTFGGDVSLTNSTVSGNSTPGDGGGISAVPSVLLVNSTVTGNSANGEGGGIHFFSGNASLTIHNSIVAGNTDNGTAPDVSGVNVGMNDLVVEHSLIGDTTGSGITATTGTGNVLNQSPMLAPLADNGGGTLTHALLPDSQAIDAGSNALALDENGNTLTTDQRGDARIQSGTVDIGAVEFDANGPFLLGDVNQDDVVDFSDISPFIDLLSSGNFLREADIDRNGVVDFGDISLFIDLLSGNPAPILLGDASQDGVVDFSDISPFIDVLSGSDFLDEADIDRSGGVDFSDIAPFINVLSGGAAQSNVVANSIVTRPISSRAPVTVQSIVVAPSARSMVSRAAQSKSIVTVALTTDVPITNELIVASVAPVDFHVGLNAFTSDNYRFLGANDSSLRDSVSDGPLEVRRTLTSFAENSLPRESRDEYRSANDSAERTFTTAAELLDAHPESLDDVLDFQLEDIFRGTI